MFEGFIRETITTSDAEINVVRRGSGRPLLLLHGAPQTHAMWHQIAPALAAERRDHAGSAGVIRSRTVCRNVIVAPPADTLAV